MRSLSFVALLMLGGPLIAQDAAQKDLKALEGTWTLGAMEVDGKEVPAEKLQGTTLTIKGDVYTVQVKDKSFPVKIKLDASKTPKHIDMIPTEGDKKDQVLRGIYRIDKDELKICRGLNADQDRPNQFATWPGTSTFVMTWKRMP